MVEGCMYKGGVVHLGEVHAVPDFYHGDMPDYTHKQLCHFQSRYIRRHNIDNALEQIRDKLLIAKVAWFCGTMDEINLLHKEIQECKEELYCAGNDNQKCIQCLEQAHALGWVFEEEEVANGLQVITPWVVERWHQEHGCFS